MANTSPGDLAGELLKYCLRGEAWPASVLDALLDCATSEDSETAREGSRALFGIVAERLSDLFEPALCDVYADLFSQVIVRALPELDAAELAARYRRIRQPRRFEGDPDRIRNVFVLSRVTLGADVAVTSPLLRVALDTFPSAAVYLVGPRKNWEMFAGEPRVRHLPVAYGRSGTLAGRLQIWPDLREQLLVPDSIVIDPDSRLSQLGLLPLGREQNYFFFESRSYGGDSSGALAVLAGRWAAETFGSLEPRPFVSPVPTSKFGDGPIITVSFGVGENHAKRIPDPFEEKLLRDLVNPDALVLVDRGAGGEESERVDRAVAHAGVPPERLRAIDSAFADFASLIARSQLYVGYDSSGQHVAAACGTPLVTVFAGFAAPRTFERWRPTGNGPIEIIRAEDPDPARVLAGVFGAIRRLRR